MSADIPVLTVRHGVIRDKEVLFRIATDQEFADWARIHIHFVLLNMRVISVDVASCKFKRNGGHYRIQAKLPRKKILHSIRLVPDDPQVATIILPPAAEYGLSDLYPMDDGKEMPEALSRANTVRDVETLGFILAQILSGKHHTDYAKTEVVKKYAYKCMQNGTDEETRHAITLIDSMWDKVDVFDEKYGKKNPVHLKVSFLYIRMLCHLIVGDFEKGLADLEEIFELRTSVPAVPLICSNLNRATLMFSWALGMADERQRASIMLDATIMAFREGAWFMPARRQRPFSELNQPLRCAAQAVGWTTALRKAEAWDGSPGAHYVAQEYSRLEGAPSHNRLAARLTQLAAFIRDNSASRNWTAGLVLVPRSGGAPDQPLP